MAVVRPELTVSEIDLFVAIIAAHPVDSTDYKRGLRELHRAQQRGYETQAYEDKRMRDLRRSMDERRGSVAQEG